MFINLVFKRYLTYTFTLILSSYIGTASAMEEPEGTDQAQHPIGREFDPIELWSKKLRKIQEKNAALDIQYVHACKQLHTVEENIKLQKTNARAV
jgi:hypothetical protein